MNNGAIKTKKAYVNRYFGILISYIIFINYVSYIGQTLMFWPNWTQNTKEVQIFTEI